MEGDTIIVHGPYRYQFEAHNITPRMVCNWIQHMHEKDWMTSEMLGALALVLAKRTGRTDELYAPTPAPRAKRERP